MDFEWDKEKAESNWRKHRIEFDLAAQVFADPNRLERYDVAHRSGEDRWQTIGMAASRVLLVVYTERGVLGEVVRVISARKANKYEHRAYRQNLP